MQMTENLSDVRRIMTRFAEQTGLADTDIAPRRYLWTDAHAVCTFLSLYRETSEDEYRRLAMTLIEQVHNVLGKHRADDPRDGWISGLSEEEGRIHPTAGGLRIGKKLGERRQSEPIDERLEWDRDGQYFHYLTKWMHALCRAAAVTGSTGYGRWARELAAAAFRGFVVAAPGGKRLHWKMSIDLSYPLVTSSGHHDPLDGYITCHEIAHAGEHGLDLELAEFAGMVTGRDWATADPLGIGGLLFDACRVMQLVAAGQNHDSVLATTLVSAALEGLGLFARERSLDLPAEYRLAFRELGLSIGLHAVERMVHIADTNADMFDAELKSGLASLQHYASTAKSIEAHWSRGDNQAVGTWREHADINEVTLATSLLPDEFLAV
jgi:hypothetical protein